MIYGLPILFVLGAIVILLRERCDLKAMWLVKIVNGDMIQERWDYSIFWMAKRFECDLETKLLK